MRTEQEQFIVIIHKINDIHMSVDLKVLSWV